MSAFATLVSRTGAACPAPQTPAFHRVSTVIDLTAVNAGQAAVITRYTSHIAPVGITYTACTVGPTASLKHLYLLENFLWLAICLCPECLKCGPQVSNEAPAFEDIT